MKKAITFFFLAFLAIVFAPNSAFASSGNTVGYVRVLHASPDAPSVDVYVNDKKVLSNVPFGANSEYLALNKGTYNVKVTPAGTKVPVVINQDIHVQRGKYYTVAATGNLSSISATVLRDKNKLTKKDDFARVRFVHFSPDAPRVDIATADGKVIFSDVGFGERNKYKSLPSGTYNLQVRLAGTNTVVLNVPGVTISEGKSYSIFALGRATGSPNLFAKVVLDRE
ncbi:MAG: DUF4397 domain-containing protein [Patescibacteria group bacterium]|nr:DUF4397 domain-containing protein [Patescibacteria group bacterium]